MSEEGVRWMEEVREGRAVGSNYQGGWLSLKILGGAVDSEGDTYSGQLLTGGGRKVGGGAPTYSGQLLTGGEGRWVVVPLHTRDSY